MITRTNSYKAKIVVFMIIGLALHATTRFYNLTSYPILNDEAIYIPYAQMIHSDFNKYKFATMENFYGVNEWKPPLQYWILSFFIGLNKDPLYVARAVTTALSFITWLAIFGMAYMVFGFRTAVFSALLYTFSFFAFFWDRLFYAEAYLNAVGLIFFLIGFRAWREIDSGQANPKRLLCYYFSLIFLGFLMLSLKTSALLYFACLPVLCFFRPGNYLPEKYGPGLKETARWFLFSGLVFVVPYAIFRWLLTDAMELSKSTFENSMVFTLKEMFPPPLETWKQNIQEWSSTLIEFQGPLFLATIAGGILFNLIKKSVGALVFPALYALMALTGILSLRYHHDYYTLTAFPFLAIYMGYIFNIILESLCGMKRIKPGAGKGIAALFFLCVLWPQLMEMEKVWHDPASSAAYRKEDCWSGFGVNELVKFFRASTRASALLDTQYGIPRDALLVYRHYYPQIKLGLMKEEEVLKIPAWRKENPDKLMYLVFDASLNNYRPFYKSIEEGPLCHDKTVIKKPKGIGRIIICRP